MLVSVFHLQKLVHLWAKSSQLSDPRVVQDEDGSTAMPMGQGGSFSGLAVASEALAGWLFVRNNSGNAMRPKATATSR